MFNLPFRCLDPLPALTVFSVFDTWWYFEECQCEGILWQLIQYSQQPLSFGESVRQNFDRRHLWTKTKEEMPYTRGEVPQKHYKKCKKIWEIVIIPKTAWELI